METARTHQGGRRPDWFSKIEDALNRAADTVIDWFGPVVKELDELWQSITRRFSRKHG